MSQYLNKEENDGFHSENVEESSNEDEKHKESIINLNISLKNGRQTSFILYDGENVEEKVKQFCENNRISPNFHQILIQKVNDELDIKPNISQNSININKISLNSYNEAKDKYSLVLNDSDYEPEEKSLLEHILNESDSIDKSESTRQSKLVNLIKEYGGENINKNNNENEGKNNANLIQDNKNQKISEDNNSFNNDNNKNTLFGDLNNNIDKNIIYNKNNNNSNSLFENDNNNLNNKNTLLEIGNNNLDNNNKINNNNNSLLENGNNNLTNNINNNNSIIENENNNINLLNNNKEDNNSNENKNDFDYNLNNSNNTGIFNVLGDSKKNNNSQNINNNEININKEILPFNNNIIFNNTYAKVNKLNNNFPNQNSINNNQKEQYYNENQYPPNKNLIFNNNKKISNIQPVKIIKISDNKKEPSIHNESPSNIIKNFNNINNKDDNYNNSNDQKIYKYNYANNPLNEYNNNINSNIIVRKINPDNLEIEKGNNNINEQNINSNYNKDFNNSRYNIYSDNNINYNKNENLDYVNNDLNNPLNNNINSTSNFQNYNNIIIIEKENNKNDEDSNNLNENNNYNKQPNNSIRQSNIQPMDNSKSSTISNKIILDNNNMIKNRNIGNLEDSINYFNQNNFQEKKIENTDSNKEPLDSNQWEQKNFYIENSNIKNPTDRKLTIEESNNKPKSTIDDISESNIIINDSKEEKEPLDNYKKKNSIKQYSKDINNQENIFQYDNNSSTNKKNKSNISIIENTDNIAYISNTKLNNNINDSYYNQNNNEKDNNNNIDNSNYKRKNSDLNNILLNFSSSNKKQNNNYNVINNFNNNNENENYGNEQFSNYLDNELEINRPKWKKKINLENSQYSPKNEINQNTIYKKKKLTKIIPLKKNGIIINQRSNSTGAYNYRSYKPQNAGERLYKQYMDKLEKKRQLNNNTDKDIEYDFIPKIDENSRKIVERLRNNENEDKVEERLINYGNNKNQKHFIQHVEEEIIKNKTVSPFQPKINPISRAIAKENKKYRVEEVKNIKNNKIKYKKLNFDEEFGKRNRSIGNEHRNNKSFINFEHNNNNNKINNIYKSNIYKNKNEKNNIIKDENRESISQLNKTFELNNVYRDLYASIDEKKDSDIEKYLGNDSPDLNNLTENCNTQEKTKSTWSQINNNKNSFLKNKRPKTPSSFDNSYNTFDILYYESEKIGEKNRKKQELKFEKNHPFKPKINPYSKNLKKNDNKETNGEFIKRINTNLEEIKIINNSSKQNNNNKNKRILLKKNSRNGISPKNLRREKSPSPRKINLNLDRHYNKRIASSNNINFQQKQYEEDIRNIYSQKSKDIIMKTKQNKYKELFDLLDSNGDGFISSSQIQLTKIDQNVLKNISPILGELNQTNKKMDFKEFYVKVDKLLNEQKYEQY